jgi:hypothetical protein
MAVDRGALARGRSVALYVVQCTLFKDARHIFLCSLTSLAFLPISVLFVTLIISRLLTGRERKAWMPKMNMVIGAFFNEIGNEFLSLLAGWDEDVDVLRPLLAIRTEWQGKDFGLATRRLARHGYNVGTERMDLSEAKEILDSRRTLLLRLMENPNLLEHEAFTALLRPVLYVVEELDYRESLDGLPETGLKQLAGDLRRAYAVLVHQWLNYLGSIKKAYPYLFSLAIRTNPFDPAASPIIE